MRVAALQDPEQGMVGMLMNAPARLGTWEDQPALALNSAHKHGLPRECHEVAH